MSACPAPSVPLPAPPLPLPPELRSDVADRRARGAAWEEVGAALRFDPDALRRACTADPAFGADFEAAWDGVMREAEAVAVRRLRRLAESDDPKVALRAAEALMRCARAHRRGAKGAAGGRPTAGGRSPVDRGAPYPPAPPRAVPTG